MKNHKLIEWAKQLPYSKELILNLKGDKKHGKPL